MAFRRRTGSLPRGQRRRKALTPWQDVKQRPETIDTIDEALATKAPVVDLWYVEEQAAIGVRLTADLTEEVAALHTDPIRLANIASIQNGLETVGDNLDPP